MGYGINRPELLFILIPDAVDLRVAAYHHSHDGRQSREDVV